MDVQLDGTAILTEDDLHDALDRALDFGPYYGRNLDALWDSLNYNVEGPIRIIWHDHAVSRHSLGEGLFGRILMVFDFVAASDRDSGINAPLSYELI